MVMISLLLGEGGDASAEARAGLIELGLSYFAKSPWLGNGINCFHMLDEAYGVYSHSNYVELLFSVGILGTISYYAMFIPVINSARKRYFKGRKNDTILCIGMVIALLFIDIALVSYYERTNLILILICYALLKNTENGEKHAEEDH